MFLGFAFMFELPIVGSLALFALPLYVSFGVTFMLRGMAGNWSRGYIVLVLFKLSLSHSQPNYLNRTHF